MVTYLLRIQIALAIPWGVLAQPENLEALSDGLEYNLFQCSGGMFTELARVRVEAVGHLYVKTQDEG